MNTRSLCDKARTKKARLEKKKEAESLFCCSLLHVSSSACLLFATCRLTSPGPHRYSTVGWTARARVADELTRLFIRHNPTPVFTDTGDTGDTYIYSPLLRLRRVLDRCDCSSFRLQEGSALSDLHRKKFKFVKQEVAGIRRVCWWRGCRGLQISSQLAACAREDYAAGREPRQEK